jgi:HK97 family phage prohead protease
METKVLAFDARETEAGTIAGYASVAGNVDRDGEVIAPGAYRGLEALVQSGFLAIGHDWTGLPVGTIEQAKADERGLLVEMQFHSTPEAQAARTVVLERLARGKSVGLSIGFFANKDHREEIDGAVRRVLDEIEVFEVSLVPVPANPLAGVTAAKGRTFDDEAEEVVVLAKRLAERAEAVARLRAEKGRTLSKERVAQIEEARAALERVLRSQRPEPAVDWEAIRARLDRIKGRITR